MTEAVARYGAPAIASSAELELTNLVFTCADLLDLGDLGGMSALFTDASFRIVNGDDDTTYRGAGEVLAMFTEHVSLGSDGTPGSKHVVTNPIVEVGDDGTSARVRSYLTVFQDGPEGALMITMCGRYDDQFRRVAGVWQFSSRTFTVDLVSGGPR